MHAPSSCLGVLGEVVPRRAWPGVGWYREGATRMKRITRREAKMRVFERCNFSLIPTNL